MSSVHASTVPAQHADLRAWFATTNEHQRAYALIDLACLQDQAAMALKHIRAAQGQSILQDGREQAALASPWLVPLTPDEAGKGMLARTLAWAAQSTCVSWLESALPLPALGQRLYERTKAELPDAYAVLLRFFDPRVLPELHRVLAPDQAESFWALGSKWLYLGRDQQPHAIALAAAPQADAFVAPLKLNKAQFDELMSASEVDTVMPELVKEAPDAFLALLAADRAAFTQRCLMLADAWHVQAFAQRVMVAVLALKLGEGFHLQAAWAPWIEQLRQGKIDFMQAIEGATSSR